MRGWATLPEPKVLSCWTEPHFCLPTYFAAEPNRTHLLNDDLLLLRINPTLRRLRSYRNYSFTECQGRRKVMERSILRNHGDFPSIHHHSGPDLGLSRHFNDVTMLDEGIEFQVDGLRLFSFGNNGETVFLALHRLFPRRFVGLDSPVIRSFAQARNRDIRSVHSFIN